MNPRQVTQTFSHFPAQPVPFSLPLVETGEQECPYLFGRTEATRGFYVTGSVAAEAYQQLLDAAFRRSGRVFYQPICQHCRQCVPIRLRIGEFARSKSNRRTWNKNGDVRVTIHRPRLTDEKFVLYQKYLLRWHGRQGEDCSREGLESWLYDSPVDTREFEYRDPTGKLLAVGICDVLDVSLSSVYFYFDPDEARRSLGTFSALYEIDFARQLDKSYYYLGYWVSDCPAMSYKSRFQPAEILQTDGIWRAMKP